MNFNIFRIKLVVLTFFAGSAILAFTFGRDLVSTTNASISGPPASRTSAPGEQNCTSCHNPGTGAGQFSITAPASYTPGQTYTIQVRHINADTTRKRWGFELTSLANNAMAGTFANIAATTKIIAGSGRSYIEQTTAGTFQNQLGGATWTFNWTAPTTNVGAVTFYAAGIQANNDGSESGDQTYTTNTIVQAPPAVVIRPHVFSDFDGDGKSDVGVYRAADGMWYVNRSANSQFSATPFGLGSDTLTPADFDGDNKTDVAVWRSGPALTAGFYILQSTTSTVRFEQFGQTGDDPSVVGDWDGDGKADAAVYRTGGAGSQSYFYYRGSLNNPAGNTAYVPWGTSGDRPLRADFDGDGKQDASVFRPSNQVWYILQSSTSTVRFENWGVAIDKIVLGDFDGDGKTDPTVYRNGVWYIKQSSNGSAAYVSWGLATDTPVTGDFDSDGKSDVGVYRSGTWYLRLSSTSTMSAQQFGAATDTALAGLFTQ
ncbi:MAG TPA: hypothetical protein PLD38_01920 [Pyrinomonadaceae bacterium]|nr:hypothetical protein [Chloracidobacterium sp.]MBP9935836.1 hypothetical protein [Pyrinomonadaceae bacterium]MBK7802999.1 hypothetical protein [Chloracidobacterium sp.]MBK9438352.1 hypothetical protein [Chloracidobacterium sp.]MBK9767968.1 hypothetical protein [Chloracidobacterium sp.]